MAQITLMVDIVKLEEQRLVLNRLLNMKGLLSSYEQSILGGVARHLKSVGRYRN